MIFERGKKIIMRTLIEYGLDLERIKIKNSNWNDQFVTIYAEMVQRIT